MSNAMEPTLASIGQFVGQTGHLRVLADAQTVERQNSIPPAPRRNGLHPRRTGQGRIRRSRVGKRRQADAGKLALRDRRRARGAAEPSGYRRFGVTGIEIIQVAQDYPITPKEHGVDLPDGPPSPVAARCRANGRSCAFGRKSFPRFRAFSTNRASRSYDPPILTPSSCEGTTNLFHTKYFDEDAYLTQSGQLYMEAAAMALGKVYSFGPTFRAEKSKTRRHLIEFWMIEPEMAFVDHEENLRVQEQFISHVVGQRAGELRGGAGALERDVSALERVMPPFPRITYDEALDLLKEIGMDLPWGEDFGAPHETAIAEKFDRPVFITHYPASFKAFYMKPDPNRPEVVLCADMIAPEGYGEIIGGSQRIDDPALMEERFKEHDLSEEAYQWYMDLRKYGTVPHSGFGLGLERTVAWICGLDHVRETIAFPRMLYRLYP